ncbi:Fic family protein [Spinactinospora alkalitolerans]|uniref:Fic family protein n=1 Tax=Spinactinospora alkalitolerans TaxID=687207 RepID=A0A852TRW6_9ACTN|nr:oxidoreductase [Spinactinospora alkalitolerans]NYE44914.1 Fic family protein [Spinactinospora alkalitolerans]
MSAGSADPLLRIAELPGVDEAVQETRAIVDRLLGHRVLRRRSADVSMEAALRGARASAVLEGADASLEQVRSGESDDPRVKGALRVSGELGGLVETWPKAPRQVLARLHVLAAADAVPTDSIGRPRLDGETAEDPLGIGPAPGAALVSERIDALNALLSARAAVPALVVSAIVHGELVALRPFGWGDGIIARAAERLTLIERGLDPKSLVPSELGHAELREEYGPALRGYLSGKADGMAEWIVYCARAVAAGARDSLATCEALKRG